jgi:hypothetical protein
MKKGYRWVFLYVIKFTRPKVPTLYYFGIHNSTHENYKDDPYMGSPTTFAPLWRNKTFIKQRSFLTVRPYSSENFYILKAREAIIIQEAWKKYGSLTNALSKLKIEMMFRKQDPARSLREIYWKHCQTRENALCLNMTDGAPQKKEGGYQIYLDEKKRLAPQELEPISSGDHEEIRRLTDEMYRKTFGELKRDSVRLHKTNTNR